MSAQGKQFKVNVSTPLGDAKTQTVQYPGTMYIPEGSHTIVFNGTIFHTLTEEEIAALQSLLEEDTTNLGLPKFDGVVESAVISDSTGTDTFTGIFYIKSEKQFAAGNGTAFPGTGTIITNSYHSTWESPEGYYSIDYYKTPTNKLFVCENKVYLVTSSGITEIGTSTGGESSEMETIEWDYNSNANTFIEAGTYRIKGQRTNSADNLPIMNAASGHSIDGILIVLDSTLSEDNTSDEYNACITQVLMLSNRVGGQEGDMYMRSAYGATKDSLTWKSWEKYQTNVEVGIVTNDFFVNPYDMTRLTETGGMNSLTESGIYSGVYIPQKALLGTPSIGDVVGADPVTVETFVMVVINNYFLAKEARSVAQIKFAVTNGGVFSIEKRITQPGTDMWSQWEPINGGSDSDIIYENDSAILGSKAWGADSIKIGKKASIGNSVFLPSDLSFSTSAEGLTIKIGSQSWTISNIG